MSISRIALFAGLLAAAPAFAQSPGLGAKITEADVGAWAITILPDGSIALAYETSGYKRIVFTTLKPGEWDAP